MASQPNIDRLKSQLLNSGLQQKDFPLYQVINQLIEAVRTTANAASSGGSGGGSSSTTIISGIGPIGPPGMTGDDGDDGSIGPPGTNGLIGPPGPAGANAVSQLYAFDGTDGEDGFAGTPGATGQSGTQGIQGFPGIPGFDGTDGIDGVDSFIPGSPGTNGTIGINGSPGPPGLDAEECEYPYIIPGPAGASGNGVVLTSFIKNLGVGDRSGTFDITGLGGQTVGKTVTVVQTTDAIPSKGNARDEFEMDAIVLTGYVVDAGTIRVLWFSSNGSVVVGDYAFGYSVNVGSIGPQGPPGQSNLPGIDGIDGENINDTIITGIGNVTLTPSGQWRDIPYTAGDYTGSGGMTWTVDVGDILTNKAIVINGIMILAFAYSTTSVTAPVGTDLQIKIPFGYTSLSTMVGGTVRVSDNGSVGELGICVVGTGGTNILLRRSPLIAIPNWTASVNNTLVQGILSIAVTP